jgi:hypothetical protein
VSRRKPTKVVRSWRPICGDEAVRVTPHVCRPNPLTPKLKKALLICGLCEQWPGERARWDFAHLTEAEIEELERLITKGYGGARWRGD